MEYNYFSFALARILSAKDTGAEKSTVAFWEELSLAFFTNVEATFDLRTGIDFIANAIDFKLYKFKYLYC